MTETPDAKTYQATPRGTLLEQIMDATQAKNEREWAAMREIETLRQQVKELEFELSKKQKEAFHCGYASRNEELAALKKLSDQWHEYYRRKHHPNCALLESAGTDSLGNKCTCIECIKQDLAVLVANGKEPNPIIPEGWQLVPITPDWNMQMEGIRKLEHCTNGELECIGEKLLDSLIKHTSEIYTAMIAAAPKPKEKRND